MAPLVQLALGVATKFIPELIGKALNDDKAKEVAEVVGNSAVAYVKDKYGVDMPAIEAIKKVDSSAEMEFWKEQRQSVIDVIKLEVEDIQHAREHNQEDGVVRNLSYLVMWINPIFIALCICALIYVSTAGLASGVLATVAATLGAAINHFFQERQQVMNYRFGSSLGSKLKSFLQKPR